VAGGRGVAVHRFESGAVVGDVTVVVVVVVNGGGGSEGGGVEADPVYAAARGADGDVVAEARAAAAGARVAPLVASGRKSGTGRRKGRCVDYVICRFITFYKNAIFIFILLLGMEQGCQMVYFQTKNPYLYKFLGALKLKGWYIFLAIWYVLRPFGTFCGYFSNLVAICYISLHFGILCQEKSGNPGVHEH
jgi:hypothetical protein